MPFDPLWIPIVAMVIGAVGTLAAVAVVSERRVEERRVQLHYEVRRLEQEWQTAQARGERR